MAEAKLRFIGTGHIRFRKFLNVFDKNIEKQIGKATKANLLLVRGEIRSEISKRRFKKNAILTTILKGKQFPLVDQKEMMQAIEIQQRNAFIGRVGFLKNKQTSHGGKMIDVARILHDGTEATNVKIKITNKMRRFLFGRARANDPKKFQNLPKKKSTGFIRIPGRPFMDQALRNKALNKRINQNWEDAVGGAIRVSSK